MVEDVVASVVFVHELEKFKKRDLKKNFRDKVGWAVRAMALEPGDAPGTLRQIDEFIGELCSTEGLPEHTTELPCLKAFLEAHGRQFFSTTLPNIRRLCAMADSLLPAAPDDLIAALPATDATGDAHITVAVAAAGVACVPPAVIVRETAQPRLAVACALAHAFLLHPRLANRHLATETLNRATFYELGLGRRRAVLPGQVADVSGVL